MKKLPALPHDPTSERAVLGCMLLDPACIEDVRDGLSADDFHAPIRAKIFEAVLAVAKSGKGLDTMLVESEMRARGADSDALAELLACTDRIPTEVAAYTARVKNLAVARRLIRTALQVAAEGYEPIGDLSDYLDRAEAALKGACELRSDDVEIVPIGDAVADVFRDWQKRADSGNGLLGVSTGLHALDRVLGGFQPGKVYVIAGRPGMGKSALAQQGADHVASVTRRAVPVFSLEMTAQEWALRILSARAGVNSRHIATGTNLGERAMGEVMQAANAVDALPIFLPKSSTLTAQAIRRMARKLHTKHGGLGLVVVDYLQLVTAAVRGDNREREIAEISRSVKLLAGELSVPILLLSQLNRAVESRTDKRPMLADLRESGSIEQDADVVIFVYRDEVYRADSGDKGIAELIIAKHRGGPTGVVKVGFQKEFTRFVNIDTHHAHENPTHWGADA